jgi:hypothetical protein
MESVYVYEDTDTLDDMIDYQRSSRNYQHTMMLSRGFSFCKLFKGPSCLSRRWELAIIHAKMSHRGKEQNQSIFDKGKYVFKQSRLSNKMGSYNQLSEHSVRNKTSRWDYPSIDRKERIKRYVQYISCKDM